MITTKNIIANNQTNNPLTQEQMLEELQKQLANKTNRKESIYVENYKIALAEAEKIQSTYGNKLLPLVPKSDLTKMIFYDLLARERNTKKQ